MAEMVRAIRLEAVAVVAAATECLLWVDCCIIGCCWCGCGVLGGCWSIEVELAWLAVLSLEGQPLDIQPLSRAFLCGGKKKALPWMAVRYPLDVPQCGMVKLVDKNNSAFLSCRRSC
jgi:hypothetical protein